MGKGRIVPAIWASCLLSAALWLAGCQCAGSLHPLESSDDLTLSTDLTGTWESIDNEHGENEVYRFESAGENGYRVTQITRENDRTPVYELYFVQVGNYTFFDVAFSEIRGKKEKATAYDLGVLPIHLIGRIWLESDTLRLGMLNYDWLHEMTQSGKLKLPYLEHHKGDDDLILLTADPDDLRDFVRQYAEDPSAFSVTGILRRVPPPETPSDPHP